MQVSTNTRSLKRDLEDLSKAIKESGELFSNLLEKIGGVDDLVEQLEQRLGDVESEFERVSVHIGDALEDVDVLENHECEE